LSEDVWNNSAAGVNAAAGAVASVADFGSANDDFLQQLTAINVGADLTENVSTQIRVINQRVWGALDDGAADQSTVGAGGQSSNDVELSLANITLKELFYSPLTVTIGRQPLWFGRGFIVGSRLVHGDVDPGDNIAADEFSDLTAFDAIRGTLDLAGTAAMDLPVVVDVIWAKVEEDDVSVASTAGDSSTDDTNLYGVNLGTKFDSMNGEAEAYYFGKQDNSVAVLEHKWKARADTIGLRGSASPMEGSSVWGELAYQWGHRITSGIAYDAEGAAGDDYQAWAANLGADYSAGDVAWSPTVGGEWIWYSGDDSEVGSAGSAIGGWDPVYRGRFSSLLREFQAAGFYVPAQSGATVGGTFAGVTNSTTNQHTFALHGTVKPIEDLTIDNRFSWFLADKGIRPTATAKRYHYFGGEWDVQANYDYTDDVKIGAVWGIFMPGNVFRSPYDETAQELVTSVSVKF
jgi:hypothetical protein